MGADEQMNLEIQEAIKKSLPNQVGEALKERLAQADRDAKEVKLLNDKINDWIKLREEDKKTIEAYRKFEERNSKLEEREKAVAEQERNLKLQTLEYQLNSEKEKTQFSKEVVMGLVRNTEYRTTVFSSDHKPGYTDKDGKWVPDLTTNKNLSETKIKD